MFSLFALPSFQVSSRVLGDMSSEEELEVSMAIKGAIESGLGGTLTGRCSMLSLLHSTHELSLSTHGLSLSHTGAEEDDITSPTVTTTQDILSRLDLDEDFLKGTR